MAGITYGKDAKPFQCPPAPAYYSGQQVKAFGRGFDWYVFAHRDGTLRSADPLALSRTRYMRRGMRQAFLEGWDAARKLDT
jgi:hypothetical protein